jgi:hypothetical protein
MQDCNAAIEGQLMLAAKSAGLEPDPDGYRLIAKSDATVATVPLRAAESASAQDWRRGVQVGFVVFQHRAEPETIPPGEYVLWARIVDRVVETYLINLHRPEIQVRPVSSQLTSGCSNQPEPGEGYICLNLCSCGFTPGGGHGISCFTLTSCFAWNP